MIMLASLGLFDASGASNQVQLQPSDFVSEVRLESYDQGMSRCLSDILVSDAYVAAEDKARTALARGNKDDARSALKPFADQVGRFQAAAKAALTNGNLFRFAPKRAPAKPS